MIRNHNIQSRDYHLVAAIGLWLGVFLLAGISVWMYELYGIGEPLTNSRACTADAMQCPDGSYVNRTGANCEFAKCAKSSIAQDDISGWKMYRNEQFGFGFSYPSDWNVEVGAYWDGGAQREIPDSEFFIKSPSKKWSLGVFPYGMYGFGPHADVDIREKQVTIGGKSARRFDAVYYADENGYFVVINVEGIPGFPSFDISTGPTTILKEDFQVLEHIIGSFYFFGTPLDISTWQTYRNEEYGFEFKYPEGWALEEVPTWDSRLQEEIPRSAFLLRSQTGSRMGVFPFGVEGFGFAPDDGDWIEKKIIISGSSTRRIDLLYTDGKVRILIGPISHGKYSGFQFSLVFGSKDEIHKFEDVLSTFKFTK